MNLWLLVLVNSWATVEHSIFKQMIHKLSADVVPILRCSNVPFNRLEVSNLMKFASMTAKNVKVTW